MLHPVFRLAAAQPQLLAEHAAAYAGLLADELSVSGAHIKRRLALQVAGVAVLLWASLPEQVIRLPWLLWATPLAPGVLGLLVLWSASRHPQPEAFAALRLQLAEDAALLRGPVAP